MKLFFIAKFWIPLALVTTILSGLIFLSIQQNFRQNANDPQIQMAEDASVALDSGASPMDLVGPAKIDVGKSLAPFVIVYDVSGKVLAS